MSIEWLNLLQLSLGIGYTLTFAGCVYLWFWGEVSSARKVFLPIVGITAFIWAAAEFINAADLGPLHVLARFGHMLNVTVLLLWVYALVKQSKIEKTILNEVDPT